MAVITTLQNQMPLVKRQDAALPLRNAGQALAQPAAHAECGQHHQEAAERRSGACRLGEGADRAALAAGLVYAVAQHEQVERHHDGPDALNAHEPHHAHAGACGQGADAADGDRAAHAETQQQAAADDGADDVAQRHREHQQAVLGFGHAPAPG